MLVGLTKVKGVRYKVNGERLKAYACMADGIRQKAKGIRNKV
jgi:hypothetical protein